MRTSACCVVRFSLVESACLSSRSFGMLAMTVFPCPLENYLGKLLAHEFEDPALLEEEGFTYHQNEPNLYLH